MRLCRFCFGLVIYINIYITHVKILIYFTPENYFFQSDFSFFGPVYHRTGPVYRSNRSVYRSGPIALRDLNSNLRSPGFRPVPDRTGPVNRYRTSPVRSGRSVRLTLLATTRARTRAPGLVVLIWWIGCCMVAAAGLNYLASSNFQGVRTVCVYDLHDQCVMNCVAHAWTIDGVHV
jgi:hypothetical protein